ncbi:MAG TPA: hypothetical protein VGL72_00335 [Bryobacteraceae bacterium]
MINASYNPINAAMPSAMALVCTGAAVVQELLPCAAHRKGLIEHAGGEPSHRLPLWCVTTLFQYCQRALPAAKLTLDHLTGKSRGGRSTWGTWCARRQIGAPVCTGDDLTIRREHRGGMSAWYNSETPNAIP